MANRWLKSGLEKTAVFSKIGSEESLELSSLEFRALCSYMGVNRQAVKEAAEEIGLSKVAASSILLEKLALDPVSLVAAGGIGGAVGKAIASKLSPYYRAIGKGILPRKAKQEIALENVIKEMNKLPRGAQDKLVGDVMGTTGRGPTTKPFFKWTKDDALKALGLVGGVGGAGYIAGQRQKSKKGGGNKVVVV